MDTTPTSPAVLSVRDHMTIKIGTAHYKYQGVRDTDTAYLLGYTPGQLSTRMGFLITYPPAIAAYPIELNRMARLRHVRQSRSARRTGFRIE